jgi:hypothetical protein
MEPLEAGSLSKVAHELPDATAADPSQDHPARDGAVGDDEQRFGRVRT